MSSPPARVDIVRTYPDTRWGDDGPTRGVESVLEGGAVLSFPQLPFVLSEPAIEKLRFVHTVVTEHDSAETSRRSQFSPLTVPTEATMMKPMATH